MEPVTHPGAKSESPDELAGALEPATAKLGGALAVAGGLGYLATLLLHGDLPDETTATALDHIAGRPEWLVLKLAALASAMCWLGAFCAFGRSMTRGASGLIARWATTVATVGVAVVVVEYAIIGHALKQVADEWNVASGAEVEAKEAMAEVLLAISGGLFHSFVAWMIGLPYFLLGLAFALDKRHPRWFGVFAATAGSGAFIAGITRFAGVDLIPYPLLYGGFVLPLQLWLAAAGVLLWRRTRLA
jgi:hypothetical protein